MQVFPSLQEFGRLAGQYTLIPVYVKLPGDMETAVSIYCKLVGEQLGYILESADTSNETFGRFSFIGAEPMATFAAYKDYVDVIVDGKHKSIKGSPLIALQEYMKRFSMPELADLLGFSGGLVGYFAYETMATWERIRGMEIPEDMLLAQWMCCRVLAAIDHLTHTVTMIYLAEVRPEAEISSIYHNACQRLSEICKQLNKPVSCFLPTTNYRSKSRQSSFTGDGDQGKTFQAMVKKAQEYIAAGDAFQVVLSQEFTGKAEVHPFRVYRRLRQVNPSPYMFYMNFGRYKLAGASPEMLVKIQQGRVETCPIAGTRPRGWDMAEDDRLAEQLLADEKEKAEHAMLVDLGRNDIGRVSAAGTVRVPQMMQVEKFSHVMHLVSRVCGRLDKDRSVFDAFASCFPAGTVSGAPKIRAMEIIRELEQDCRGLYAGAAGYFDFKGNMDTCIAIRTLFFDGDTVKIRAGAGIVADSIPENEYQEVLHKAGVLFQVAEEAAGYDSVD